MPMAWMVSALCKWLVASWVDCWEKPLASPSGFLVRYSLRHANAISNTAPAVAKTPNHTLNRKITNR